MVPVLGYGDAIGNDTLAIRDVIRHMGITTDIYYTDRVDKRFPEGTARPVGEMPALQAEDILIYHACTGAPINFELPKYGGRKVMIYHNVTPPAFFRGINSDIEKIQQNALDGFRFLADRIDYCIADSEYNRQDLLGMGYRCPIDVCPIVIPFSDYDAEPDAATMERMRADKHSNLLFVGRITPNKRQEDIIRAFACYRRRYEPGSRLILIGSAGGTENYLESLKAYVRKLGLEDSVIFPGHIRFSEILAYYRTADAFVCMSEHEGFCVPLVEAMYFGVPIVAFNAAAVPDTLGGGGLLLDSKEPAYVAAAIDRVLNDRNLRRYLNSEQAKVLKRFSHEETEKTMSECIRRAMSL